MRIFFIFFLDAVISMDQIKLLLGFYPDDNLIHNGFILFEKTECLTN